MDSMTGVLVALAVVVGFFLLRDRKQEDSNEPTPPGTSPASPAARSDTPPQTQPPASVTATALTVEPPATTPATESSVPPPAPSESAVVSPTETERQELLDAVASLEKFVTDRAIDRDCLDALHTLGNLSLDLDAPVRAAAVEAIGCIASPDAIPYLERALRDRDLDVVRAASAAIGRYKFYPATDEERQLLPLNAAAIADVIAAIDTLASPAAPVAKRETPPAPTAPAPRATDPEAQERLETIAAIQIATEGRPVDTEALQAVELLGELSLDRDATVRQAAVAAIGNIPSAEAIPYLERALRDSDSDVVGAASAAIDRYKFYPPAPEIEPLLPLNAAPDAD